MVRVEKFYNMGTEYTFWWWADYTWETKTISNSSVELWIRTIVEPDSNFTLNIPSNIIDGEEYVIRTVSTDSYTMTLGTWFTNPFDVDLTLSDYATDQYVFIAIDWTLELQPLFTTN